MFLPTALLAVAAPLILHPLPLPFMPGAAIFDCDGTLVDTMPLHFEAWRETLEPLGAPFPEEQFYAWGGVTAFEIVDRLNALHNLQMPTEATALKKEALYRTLLHRAKPIEAVVAEAKRFKDAGVPIAVASGGLLEVVEASLKSAGLWDFFDALATADDVQNGKPAPDTFLVAAERLGVAPKDCIVYEDAPAGLEAARRAGMGAVDVNLWVETAGKAALARLKETAALPSAAVL